MAELFEGPDAVRAFLTGAAEDGLGQYDHAASLGGFRSSARVYGVTSRAVHAFPGIRVQFVEASNGLGVGRLLAERDGVLKWAAPGEEFGASVPIANGETKVLMSETASKFVVVRRTSVLQLRGVQNVQIADTLNNVVGMTNFTSAQSTAGAAKRRGLILKNVGATNATNVKAWVDATLDTRMEIGSEALVDGEIQTIADEDTDPTGVTFSTPTSGSPLALGTLTPEGMIGLWLRTYVGAGANAEARVVQSVVLQFTVSGVTYTTRLRGAHSVAEAGHAAILCYFGENEDPDWTGAPDEELADDYDTNADGYPVPSAPLSPVFTFGDALWYLRFRARNAYGIVGPPTDPVQMRIVSGAETQGVPSGPATVQVRPWTAGGFKIDARYIPDWDTIGERATHWRIYYTADGTAPDPLTDTPVDVAMGYNELLFAPGQVFLSHAVETALLEDTPVEVLVRTVRIEVDELLVTTEFESVNTETFSTALEYCGPGRPDGVLMYRDGLGIYQSPVAGPNETVVIDAGNGIEWEMLPGQTRLWADGALLLNHKFDSAGGGNVNGCYTPLSHDGVTINEVGSADPIEVISWTVGDKRIGINVNEVRVIEIDVTNNIIRCKGWFGGEEPSGACQGVPIWPKWAHTVFMVWDASTTRYTGVTSVDADGDVYSKVGFFTGVPEADCL